MPSQRPSSANHSTGARRGARNGVQPMRSADRLLQVLTSFTEANPHRSISDIARELVLPVTTVRRLVATLERFGLVRQSGHASQYGLGFEAIRLAEVALRGVDLVRDVGPFIDAVRAETGESVLLHVLDATGVITVSSRLSSRPIKIYETVGSRFAAAGGSSSGKVLLASLGDDIVRDLGGDALLATVSAARVEGYATNDGETDPGIWSVSAPVRDHTAAIVAAITVPTLRSASAERKDELVAAVVTAARSASLAMHCRPTELTA